MGFFSKLFTWDDKKNVDPGPSKTGPSELDLDPKTQATMLAVLDEIDVNSAIATHENWKLRLTNHLNSTSSEQFDPAVVCLDNRCDLGQWLHGAGRERLGKYPAFSVLVARHKYFHIQASTVLLQQQSGDSAAAEKTLNGSFKHGSNQVTLLLKELKRGLGRR